MCALGQHALFAYQYHTYFPHQTKIPHAVAESLHERTGVEYDGSIRYIEGTEAMIDGVYFVALVAAVLMSK